MVDTLVAPEKKTKLGTGSKEKINVMVNGLPGKMASKVADYVLRENSLQLVPYSLTGPEIDMPYIGDIAELINPDKRENSSIIEFIKGQYSPFISVDFTHPDAVNSNGYFYCRNRLPFVMGTTGGDRKSLEDRVKVSDISAIIAPNMAKQIVAFQERMKYAAENFSNALRGYYLEIVESHQKGKADTSGTASSMVEKPDGSQGHFNLLGIPFAKDQIIKIREPEEQLKLGVPEHALGGHGWHTYIVYSHRPDNRGIDILASTIKDFLEKDISKVFSDYKFYDAEPKQAKEIISNLNYIGEKIGKAGLSNFREEIYRVSEDGTASFSLHHIPEKLMVITHNVNGRDIYASGTIDAIKYLDKKVKEGSKGRVYSMIDVLKGK